MRLQQIAPFASLVAMAHAGGNGGGHYNWGTGTAISTIWTTTVVPTWTTYCPVSLLIYFHRMWTKLWLTGIYRQSPTTWAYLNTTYTVTSETTITLRKLTTCSCLALQKLTPLPSLSLHRQHFHALPRHCD